MSKPFARAIAMMAAIANAASLDFAMRQGVMAQIGPYVSRGKGKTRRPHARHGAHMDGVRAAAKRRNRR